METYRQISQSRLQAANQSDRSQYKILIGVGPADIDEVEERHGLAEGEPGEDEVGRVLPRPRPGQQGGQEGTGTGEHCSVAPNSPSTRDGTI